MTKTKAINQFNIDLRCKVKKPLVCCGVGDYGCQIPMPLNGRRQDIDFCIADIVAALNAANIPTIASCCGHGIVPGSIRLADGRALNIIYKE